MATAPQGRKGGTKASKVQMGGRERQFINLRPLPNGRFPESPNALSASPSFPEESRPNASSDLVTKNFIGELGEFGEFLELIKSNMTRFLAYDPYDKKLKYFDDTVRGADETGVYVNKISESTIEVIESTTDSTLLRCDVLYDVFAFDPVIDSRSIDSSVLKTLKYNFMAAADRSYEITKGAVNGAVNGANVRKRKRQTRKKTPP